MIVFEWFRKVGNMVAALAIAALIVLAIILLIVLFACLKAMAIPVLFFCAGVYFLYRWLESRKWS